MNSICIYVYSFWERHRPGSRACVEREVECEREQGSVGGV